MTTSLDMPGTVARTATLVAALTGIERCFTWNASAPTARIPMVIPEFPAVVIVPKRMIEYDDGGGGGIHRHTYVLTCYVFERPTELGRDAGADIAFPDLFADKFAANAGLGGEANWCRLTAWTYGVIPWGDIDYDGWETELTVSEEAAITYAEGS